MPDLIGYKRPSCSTVRATVFRCLELKHTKAGAVEVKATRMKLTLVLLALVGCVAAFSVPTSTKVKIADADFLKKQQFFFEILYRVEDPLMFEEWIKLGQNLVVDKAQYTVSPAYHLARAMDWNPLL